MAEIRTVETGVPNLERLIGEGIPKYSLNVIAGQPGTGKTILANQILFHQARSDPEFKALILTTLSEPVMKMVRYMQQFAFFDDNLFNNQITSQDIGEFIRQNDLSKLVGHIEDLVFENDPDILMIDSFKAISDLAGDDGSFRRFCWELSIRLAAARCTTFLVGEYDTPDVATGTEFAVADGILCMEINEAHGEVIRHIWVRKMRGQAADLSSTPFVISQEGIRVLGPQIVYTPEEQPAHEQPACIPTGITGLDMLLQGGLLPGRCVLLSGVSGTGKTTLALQFLIEGAREGRRGILYSFEESESYLYRMAEGFGWDMADLVEKELIRIVYTPQNEIRTEEHMDRMVREIVDLKPERVVVDSFSVFLYRVREAAIQREKTFQMASVIRGIGAQAILTSDVPASNPKQLSRFGVEETVLDGTISLTSEMIGLKRRRFVEVFKMRGVRNVPGRFRMDITGQGMEILYARSAAEKGASAPPPITFEPVQHMVRGHLRYGSAWLIRGIPGVGKSTLAFQFAIQALQRKESVLYVAIDAPPNEIVNALENLSFLPEPYMETGQLRIVDGYTTGEGCFDLSDPESLLFTISRQVENMTKPMVLIFDSLSPVSLGYHFDEFVALIHKKNRLLAAPDVALFDTLLAGTLEGSQMYSMVNAYDIVVDLFMPDWGEMKLAGKSGYRAIQLAKVRGANVDGRPYPYIIMPNDGIVVQKDYYREQ